MRFLFFLLPACAALFGAESGYVGAQVCSGCHREIAASQSKTNMARTWHGATSSQLPAVYTKEHSEGGVRYRVARTADGFDFRVALPGKPEFSAPVETIIGGERHGLSFLFRVSEIEGLKLARPALVEGRYLHSAPHSELLLSPGFPEEPPVTYETALGRVLSPEFEQKCLGCHGAAKAKQSHETGVRCENCHGPAESHLTAVANGKPRNGVLNPKRTSAEEQIAQCAQCHAGFGDLYDSIPDDLLISNQANAIKKSQCWIQSGGAFSCVGCHNPHKDGGAPAASERTCLGCHSNGVTNRAALCPVNQKSDCLKCHMPVARKGSFEMVDHWIRVHPAQPAAVPAGNKDALRTTVRPRVLYLRMITAQDRASADAAKTALDGGKAFFEVARQYSKDVSALAGGFIGEMEPDKLDPRIASAALAIDRGAYSPVVDLGNRFVIMQRMPRDYLYEAGQLETEGTRLRKMGKLNEAAETYTRALMIYPQFLRALVFLGVTLGEQGNAQRSAGVLEHAARLYPQDPAAHYNLGMAYESLGRAEDAVREYRRAVDLQADLIPAYLNLGGVLFQAGRLEEAAQAYARGLQANPLIAGLYYNVAQVYEKQGKADEARHAQALAFKLDPSLARRTASR